MMEIRKAGFRRLAFAWRMIRKTPLTKNCTQYDCISKANPLPPTPRTPQTNIQPMRHFSLIPGKGDCKKNKSQKCPKCPKKKTSEGGSGCCPHPPPACAAVCRGCPPEKKPLCPLPTRPPQPCHCPMVMDVKHKPGQCPGPCDEEEKC